MGKTVCFIGHRNISYTEELYRKMYEIIKVLINEEDVTFFLFGSRSKFNLLCHDVVTELQKIYPHIKRIAYTCRHECAIIEEHKADTERIIESCLRQSLYVRAYDKEYDYPTKYISGKASYVERNEAMINDSDFCIFYYDENYLPLCRKQSKNSLIEYQSKSGTALAYKYALQKKKTIINLYIYSL